MSEETRPVVHAITALPDGSLVCRYCGTTASSVTAPVPDWRGLLRAIEDAEAEWIRACSR